MNSDKPRYRIKTAAIKTGIPPITLRAWERRYQILTPNREDNRYRLYSDADIEILKWLKFQVDSGVQISQLAHELKEMSALGKTPALTKEDLFEPKLKADSFPLPETIDRLYQHLKKHDERSAAAVCEKATRSLPLIQLFEQLLIPILVRIGEDWYNGRIMVATEHFASSFIRARLMTIFQKLPPKSKGPRILIGCAPEDLHELGALMLAILIREAGFAIEYIGPDIPLDDLAEYAAEEKIDLIILSATTVESAELLSGFKKALDRQKRPPLFAYGGAAFSYKPDLLEKTPGIYLGKTLSQSLKNVQGLFTPGR